VLGVVLTALPLGQYESEISVLTPTKKKAKPVNPETELDAE